MLYASKRELHASLALEILGVREQELGYYTANINNIGLQASLLAGFAFSTLSSHNSLEVLSWIEQPVDQPFVIIDFAVGQTSAQEAKVLLEILYLISTISAMGSTLYTLYVCLITSILGPGLALRGPEGSVDRAVLGLARVNRKVIGSFAFALDLFQFSILVSSFLNFHLISALVCACFSIYYMVRIRRYRNLLATEFMINPGLIVTGRFEDDGEGRQVSVAEQHLFPSFREQLRYRAERRRERRAQKQKQSTDIHQPSTVASNMMYHWQGPLPEEIEAEVAAEVVPQEEGFIARWLGGVFGADAAQPPPVPPPLRRDETRPLPIGQSLPSARLHVHAQPPGSPVAAARPALTSRFFPQQPSARGAGHAIPLDVRAPRPSGASDVPAGPRALTETSRFSRQRSLGDLLARKVDDL
jgi:hypothetical protein